jgi:EF-P beta-lysylation protein EpmB
MDIPLWRTIWQRNFTHILPFLDFCAIEHTDRKDILTRSPFSFSVPERLAKKIEKGNINDPLFRQFVPFKAEEQCAEGFQEDPLDESAARCSEKMLHKYRGRALVVTTQSCGMHCRFCFRRHYAYSQGNSDFHEEITWLQRHEEIDEVILSGGDPLALPTHTLGTFLSALNAISHIKRLRIHTRFPIGIPERIDHNLLQCLQKSAQQLFVVLHVNHPRELDDDVQQSFSHLLRLGIPLLSQTVLLRGVNDSVDVLKSLMTALGNSGVIPYYLHQLDRVNGAAHFEVPAQKGLQLIESLRSILSGYLVPKFVQEVAGEPCKKAVTSDSEHHFPM